MVGSPARRWEFWAEHAERWILEAVKHGVPLDFASDPPYQKPRDNFIREHEQVKWMDEEVARLVEEGTVRELREEEWCWISPMHLVDKPGPKRFRLVIDMRAVNEHLMAAKCKFEGLGTILRMSGPGWWAFSFDLEAGYHHFLIREKDQKWLGFKWGGKRYVFRVLPFGLSVSPLWFTKILRTVVRKWRRSGILVVAYLDDFIVLARSAAELRHIRDKIIEPDLANFGLVRAPAKGHWEPTQVINILGLQIDFVGGLVKIPKDKIDKCRKAAALVAKGDPVSARALAAVSGKFVSLARAFAPARLYTREFYKLIDAAGRRKWEWDDTVVLTEKAIR